MDPKWFKYTWVCTGECDALIEYTFKSGYTPNVIDITCLCGSPTTLLSVEDATIPPMNTQKEETMETTITINEAYNPNLLVTYKKIENGETSYPTDKVVDIEYSLDQGRRWYKSLTEKQNEWYRKESQLRTLLEETFADSEDQETLTAIAEIFDVPLTKEVEYTAWVRVDLTVEVELGGDMDSIEDFISSNLTIDSYDALIQVTNHDVDRVEEGAY
jgi:hypothetical protein